MKKTFMSAFVAAILIPGTLMASPVQPNMEANKTCEIMVCVWDWFPSGANCGRAKKEFFKRLFKRKSPYPYPYECPRSWFPDVFMPIDQAWEDAWSAANPPVGKYDQSSKFAQTNKYAQVNTTSSDAIFALDIGGGLPAGTVEEPDLPIINGRNGICSKAVFERGHLGKCVMSRSSSGTTTYEKRRRGSRWNRKYDYIVTVIPTTGEPSTTSIITTKRNRVISHRTMQGAGAYLPEDPTIFTPDSPAPSPYLPTTGIGDLPATGGGTGTSQPTTVSRTTNGNGVMVFQR